MSVRTRPHGLRQKRPRAAASAMMPSSIFCRRSSTDLGRRRRSILAPLAPSGQPKSLNFVTPLRGLPRVRAIPFSSRRANHLPRASGLDDAGLAAVQGCSLDALTSLRLCRRPGVVEPQRRVEEERTKIAGRFGVDPVALKRVVAVTLPAYVVTPHPWRVPSEGGNRF